MKLPLRYYGDPILRKKALPVKEITPEIKQLVLDMIETMQEHRGLGLAAPQVGVSLRIFVACIDHEDKEGEIHLGSPKVYINPILHEPSEALVDRNEGCLSIPGVDASVTRPLTVTVEATDLEGNLFRQECYGYVARCMMHENDHLNGVLFIDRIKGKRRTLLEPKLKDVRQEYHSRIN